MKTKTKWPPLRALSPADFAAHPGLACVAADTEAFFDVDTAAATSMAKRLCAGCPVRRECLAWALDNREEYGLWGGTTPKEREALLRRRARATRVAAAA